MAKRQNDNDRLEIHLPSPSWWPLVLTIGITLFVLGIVFSFYLAGLGLIVFLIALVGWLREPTGLEDHH
ncbi:MAG: hypothetical protein MAG451_01194 [Anaerolineales bacterium]|nr:hypothetical protein [Anaerolineales bacterium]